MSDLVEFSAAGMSGWVREADPERRVLLLHGGPTMPHSYLESLVAVLPGWSVASYQQRGRAPSTSQGPFDVPTLIDDLAGVMTHLADQGWERPLLAGHSWGGHLVWHAATTLAGHIGGALAIDPLGAVGDMGLPAFGAAISERMTPEARTARTSWKSGGRHLGSPRQSPSNRPACSCPATSPTRPMWTCSSPPGRQLPSGTSSTVSCAPRMACGPCSRPRCPRSGFRWAPCTARPARCRRPHRPTPPT